MRPAPPRPELSKLLERLLPNEDAMTHFIAVHFPTTFRQLSASMSRTQRKTVLLGDVEERELFDAMREEFPDDVELRLCRGSTLGDALSAALGLDRARQFALVKELCVKPTCTLFLLFGPDEQAGLAFFRARIETYLVDEIRHHGSCVPRVVIVPLTALGMRASSGEEWGVRIKDALSRTLGQFGTLDECLARASAAEPLFLMLGQYPFDDRLTDSDWEGLEQLLSEWLPNRLRGKKYVHTLVAYEYGKTRQSRVKQLLSWCQRGQNHSHAFVLESLPEAELPVWEDALRFLQDTTAHSPLPPQRIEALRTGFEEIRKKKSYEKLAKYLDI